jgi:hypothetical protein
MTRKTAFWTGWFGSKERVEENKEPNEEYIKILEKEEPEAYVINLDCHI